MEDPFGLDAWEIYVNDHNKREYTFKISSDSIYQPNLLALLAHNGVRTNPFYSGAFVKHLLYTSNKCEETESLVYQNNVLGWYEFEGKPYYFYDETDFDGNHSICSRNGMLFKKGSRENYMQFLQDTVFPSTELSLALTIGYSAVVASRLCKEKDLRNNNRKSLRHINHWQKHCRNVDD